MTPSHPIVFLIDVDNTLLDNDAIQQDLKDYLLDDVERRYPAERYVLVDDKLRILAAVKQFSGRRVTTVFTRQGSYALDPTMLAFPSADVMIEGIASATAADVAHSCIEPGVDVMKPTKTLHDLGQSLWLDNITRNLVNSGTLHRYIEEFSVTGLTSNPTIFDHAIKNSTDYDGDISQSASLAKAPEDLFFDLALADLTRAADLFQPIFARTDGVDGWVSLEVSPLLAHDTNRTLGAARDLHQRGGKPNLFIKIPGTAEGLPAIEAAIFAGVPINITLLFSREQYIAAAEAYLRGVERRIAAGLNPAVASVASLFISRWDVAISGKVPGELTNRLGIAVAQRTYKAYLELLASPRFRRIANAGARAQRLLWASTGTKDPKASDILYVRALAAPFTIDTMPENTLKAFAEHGEVGELLAVDGGDCERVLASFAKAGINVDALAAQLQNEGATSFVKSWNDLMACVESKSAAMRKAS
jgi:transaldolase